MNATQRRIAEIHGITFNEAATTKADLTKIAVKIANTTAQAINDQTPPSVSDMPYARQYTLEEVIRLLQVLV